MLKLDFKQGSESEEWLKWRKRIITATDAPIIMGASPYCTQRELWQRKNGLLPELKKTPAMQRGIDDEPIARDMFIDKFHEDVKPACIQSERYPFLGASLDGWNDDGLIVEIKSNSLAIHRSLMNGGIPSYHWMQMQHQLLCTDGLGSKAFYVSFHNKEIISIVVNSDEEWQMRYIKQAEKFYTNQMIFGMDPDPINIEKYRDCHSGNP